MRCNDDMWTLHVWDVDLKSPPIVVYFNATALTVNNVVKVVEELEWRTLSDILRVPSSKQQEIVNEFSTDKDQKLAVVKWWIMNDPLASWRRLIDRMYYYREDIIGDKIRHYCEDVTGTCVIFATPLDKI